MKILVLYRNNKGNYNHFCNVDFYKYLKEIPMTDVKFYGCQVDQLFPSLCVKKFNKDITMKELYEIYNFDVVIIAGKNRTYYTSTESQSWLPLDFDTFKCCKVLIEPDFHKYRKDSWFLERKIDVILHRHKSNYLRGIEDFPELKHYWFPFSVDTNLFKDTNKKRIKSVAFVGNSKANAYYFRKEASNILNANGLLDFEGQSFESDYIKLLNKYEVYLSGSSIYTIDCAKSFEIIASGGILLTNETYSGLRDLFGKCYVTYKNDFSDLIKNTNAILNNDTLRKKMIEKGKRTILKKHTHLKRCKDLLKILKDSIKSTKKEKSNEEIFTVPTLSIATENNSNLPAFDYIEKLVNNNIEVCLLKETCYNGIKNKEVDYPLFIGVSDINKTKNLLGENPKINLYSIPKKTKPFKFKNLNLLVPFPVIKYLTLLNYNTEGIK